jgi:TPR repeat protein/serine/threonine protein kinase
MSDNKRNDTPVSSARLASPPEPPAPTAIDPPPSALLGVGEVIAGRYVIEGMLDEGGMAVIYRARNAGTGKSVVLKVLHAQLGAQPDIVRMFAKEARVGSVIGDNAHIVEVYDAGVDADRGIPFIVMELLAGETLESALERGPLPRHHARRLLAQLANALDQAHAAGVVHRDLKPSNLFVTRDGDGEPMLKVMDFGIAKVLEEEALRTATQIGTPAYTAPEQMGSTTRRLAARQGITIGTGISPATDVWALGLIAFEVFTGQRPGHYWGIETVNELPMKVAFMELEPASGRAGDRAALLPPGFDDWFARCLRKNAAERWQSAGEAVSELLALDEELVDSSEVQLEEPATSARPVGAAPTGPTSARAGNLALSAELPTVPRQSGPLSSSPTPPPAVKTIVAAPTGYVPPSKRPRRAPPEQAATTAPTPGSGHGWALVVGGVALAVAAIGMVVARPSASDATACLEASSASERVSARCERACDGGSLASCAKLASMAARGEGTARDEQGARQLYAQACGVDVMPSGPADAAEQAQRQWLQEVQQRGCENGSCVAEACAELGRYYERGLGGLAPSQEAATALFRRACQVDVGPEARARGLAGCVGLGRQRERAGQADGARAYYRAACDGGVLDGCVAMARLLEHDRSGERPDHKQARALYQRACDGGELEACARLGKMVERGRGGWVRDEAQAVALYRRACDGGQELGCVALASAYAGGRGGVPRDAVRAAELLRRACDGDELEGCAELAAMTARGEGGLGKDEKRAFALNKRTCDAGVLLGCANLGDMYLAGTAGLARDLSEGRALFGRACDGGEPAGCLRLAKLEASAAEPDPSKVETLYTKACENGEPEGCVHLGEALESGSSGLGQDLVRAASLYRSGCDQGSMRGCTNLANLAYQGAGGLEKSAERSVELNDRACRGGDAVGCARLGMLYALGHGVPKSPERAAQLFRDACSTNPSQENASRCSLLHQLLSGGEARGGS